MSTATAAPPCKRAFDHVLFGHLRLVPAVLVIVTLQLYSYYKHKRWSLVSPFNYVVENNHKRLAIAVAFGCLSQDLFSIIANPRYENTDWYWDPLQTLTYAVEIGLTWYPTFACIESPFGLLAGVLGVLETLIFIIYTFFMAFLSSNCQTSYNVRQAFSYLPGIICNLVMLAYFLKQASDNIRSGKTDISKANICVLCKDHQKLHVKMLLSEDKFTDQLTFLKKYIWKNDPRFKYPAIIISCLMVIMILCYRICVAFIALANSIDFSQLEKSGMNLKTAFGFILGGSSVTTFLLVSIQLYFFMKVFKKDMMNTFSKGRKYIHYNYVIDKNAVIRYNMLFPGYLIAFTSVGLLVAVGILVLVFLLLYITGYMLSHSSELLKAILVMIGKLVYSIFIVSLFTLILQRIMIKFVFTEKNEKSPVFIKHMKLYHIYLFFTIFLNALVGAFSFLKTALISFITNTFWIGRLDRNLMNPEYFNKISAGHLAYISFLKAEMMFQNPVMRCFCEIVRDSALYKDVHKRENKTVQARNRWFLAVMLIRNPSLINERVKEEARKKDSQLLIV